MNKLKRFMAVIAFFAVLGWNFCFADDEYFSDIKDVMDSIYKFDVGDFTKDSSDKSEEKNPVFADLILTLGLIANDADGNFKGSSLLSYKDFYTAVMTLASGQISAEPVYTVGNVTQKDAVLGIISAAGYEYLKVKYQNSADPAGRIASDLGVLKGITYEPEKYITRLQFAQLLYNALFLDTVDTSVLGEYSQNKDSTILNERFSVYEVKGLVNAVNGINIYGGDTPDKGKIQIARAEYKIKDGGYGLFAKYVTAYFKLDKASAVQEILCAYPDEGSYLEIPFSDISECTASYIKYDKNGSQAQTNIHNIKSILYNGDSVTAVPTSKIQKTNDGSVRLIKSSGKGSYDILVIKSYENFLLSSVNTREKSFKLSYNGKMNGENKITLNDAGNLIISKKGEYYDNLSVLSPNTAISVYQNADKSFTEILASEKRISGDVSSIDSKNNVYIGEDKYTLSEEYKSLSLSQTNADEITASSSGLFYISQNGYINGFKSDSAEKTAYFRAVKKSGLIDKSVFVRLFNEKGEWETLTVSEKVKIDGSSPDATDSIYNALNDGKILDTVIKYRKNQKDEITYIDTINPDSTPTDKSMKFEADYSGKLSWNGICIEAEGTYYKLNDDTVIFKVPDNRENEKRYSILPFSSVEKEVKLNFKLYNSDRFLNIGAALMVSDTAAAAGSLSKLNVFVTSVNPAFYNDEDCYSLNGYLFNQTTKQIEEISYFMAEDAFDDYPVKKNGVYNVTFSDENMIKSAVEFYTPDITSDFYTKLTSDPNQSYYLLGTIMDFDTESNMLLVRVNNSEYAFSMNSIAIFEKANGEFIEAGVGDLELGDRVFVEGHWGTSVVTLLIR